MDMPPPATQGRRATAVVDRNLDELCACLDNALSSRQRSPYAEERLHDAIAAKTVFLRSLLAAEAECHGGGARPEHLAEAEARFAVLEAAFDRWARRAVVATAPEPVEEEEVVVGEPEEEEQADCSGSTCSCTDSCQLEATEGDAKRDNAVVEARDEEGTPDAIADDDEAAEGETAGTRREQAAVTVAKMREAAGTRQEEEVTLDAIAATKHDADSEAAAETGRRTAQRGWWRLGAAAWCGAAGVVAVVAVGLAVELAAVTHHNVNVYDVVPT